VADHIVAAALKAHVRPIKRGKAGAATELGAKISISSIDGYCFLDRLSWDAYNESADLIEQAKAYRDRLGCYPAAIHADKIYRTRGNI
jgi:transposase, IS5 family